MSARLSLAGLLISALLVTSCQGRATSRVPASGPAAFVTMLPDTFDRRPVVRAAPSLLSLAGASAPAPVSPPASAPGPTPVPSGDHPPTEPSPAPGGAAPAGPPPAAPATALAAELAAKGLADATTLMAIGRGSLLLPEDFKIGPLGDNRAAAQDEDKAMEVAGRFLTGLVAGNVDKDLLVGTSREAVSASLSFGLERGNKPTTFRVGRPRTRDDGEVTAAVRLLGQDSSSEGEIYVSPSGSRWLVSDLQLNLEQLSVKVEKPKEKFFPLEYRWLLED